MTARRRVIDGHVTVSRVEGEPAKIAGYAAVFYRADEPGTEYKFGYRYRERIHPNAFNRALQEGHDVRGLFNHNPESILGRTKSKTLRLSVDSVGLRYEIDAPDTQIGRDTSESIRRGDVSGSSFMFDILEETRIEDGDKGLVIYEIRDLKLFDVGPVTFPAYEAATSELRSDPRFRDPPKRDFGPIERRLRQLDLHQKVLAGN